MLILLVELPFQRIFSLTDLVLSTFDYAHPFKEQSLFDVKVEKFK